MSNGLTYSLTKQDTAVLKGIAIIAMLMHHLWGCPPEWVTPYTGVLGFFGNVGKVCVAIFLFCSGYGLSVGYSKVVDGLQCTMHDCKKGLIETMKFLAKRFVKFYAGYWPIFLIFVPISVVFFHRGFNVPYGSPPAKWMLITDLMGLNGLQSYNITWWFNKLIILLYLLFPILYWCVKKGGWMFLVMSFLCMRFDYKLDCVNYYELLFWQFPFVLGLFWHDKEIDLERVKICKDWVRVALCLTTFVFVVLLALYRGYLLPMIPHINAGLYLDAFACLALVLMIVLCRPYFKWLNPSIAFCGKHSMNIYLFHTFFFKYWFSEWFYGYELGGGHKFNSHSHYLYWY